MWLASASSTALGTTAVRLLRLVFGGANAGTAPATVSIWRFDANVSTSAGTSEDRIAVWKASDAMLWEGTPKFEVFRSVLGGTTDTLTARARLYANSVFSSRYSTATALVGRTALSSPSY